MEVFQQGLGVVLCLTVQAHRVELAQTVTHGTIKLLAQAMLDCGCGIRNLRTELDAVARLGRRHARFERRDQCLEASLLVGVQRTHAVDQGLGAVRDGELILDPRWCSFHGHSWSEVCGAKLVQVVGNGLSRWELAACYDGNKVAHLLRQLGEELISNAERLLVCRGPTGYVVSKPLPKSGPVAVKVL